jgi:hypothetical protein
MKRTNIYLDEDLDRLLRHLAVEQGRSFTDLVREALDEYLKHRDIKLTGQVLPPLRPTSDAAWRADMDTALQRLRAGVPENMTSDEIEDLITAASEEVRQERLARQPATASRA